MIITKNSFTITVSFEPSDWFPEGNARNAIAAFKTIPHRKYNPSDHTWGFPNIKEYLTLIESFTKQSTFTDSELLEGDKAVSDLFKTLDMGELI